MRFGFEASGRDFSGVCATVRALVSQGLLIAFLYALSVATLSSLLGSTRFCVWRAFRSCDQSSRSFAVSPFPIRFEIKALPCELVTPVGLLMKETRVLYPY
jgi:hypothetical protein